MSIAQKQEIMPALPPPQNLTDCLRAAGVLCTNPRGWWGGVTTDGIPVVTTWLDAAVAPDQFWIWQPLNNRGRLLDEWIAGNIRVGTVVRLIILKQDGNEPLHEQRYMARGQARLMPGYWRVRETRHCPKGKPAAIVEPLPQTSEAAA